MMHNQDSGSDLETMFQEQNEANARRKHASKLLSEYWSTTLCPGWVLKEEAFEKLLLTYSPKEVLSAITAATTQYLVLEKNETASLHSVERTWRMVPKILSVARHEADKPWLNDLFYIRNILENRFSRIDKSEAINVLTRTHRYNGGMIEEMKQIAKTSPTYRQWLRDMDVYTDKCMGAE